MRTKPLARQAQLEHIQQWKASGLTSRAYCQQHGLNLHTLRNWNKARSSRSDASSQVAAPASSHPACVAVTLTPTVSNVAVELLHHNGWRLCLPSAIEAVWLGQLLRQLSRC